MATTAAVLVAFFFVLALTVAPGLHHHLHADASQSQHECAITVLQSGVALTEGPPAILVPQLGVQFSSGAALHPVWVATLFSSARVFEHAPPTLS